MGRGGPGQSPRDTGRPGVTQKEGLREADRERPITEANRGDFSRVWTPSFHTVATLRERWGGARWECCRKSLVAS